MTDLQATLDAIDEVAVHECGYCRGPLHPGGPSADFCNDGCQAAWLSAKHEVQELVGYREPYDLPQHQANLVELCSPEVTPLTEWAARISYRFNRVSEFRLTVDTCQITAALERAEEGFRQFGERLAVARSAFEQASVGFRSVFDGVLDVWTGDWRPVGLGPLEALELSNPELDLPDEPLEGEPFGADYNFDWRPVQALHADPAGPVLPVLPDRDWQALVDARTANTGPVRAARAPRHLGRTR